MEPTKNIYQRMHAVMQDISYVQKGDKMVNGQYRFVGHDAVTSKVREALVKHGIIALTDVTGHTQDGNRTEVDLVVTFQNVDDPQDRATVRAFGYGIDPQDKGPGKAISYAVKYAYLKAFALETGDDPEKDSIDHKPAPNVSQLQNKVLPSAIPANVEGIDAFEALPEDVKAVVREWAMEVIALVKEGKAKDANAFLHEKCTDQESKLAIWTQLPSDTRSKLKAAGKPSLAEQA